MYGICDFECMYVLCTTGGLGHRQQLQVLHEKDPCCFKGEGRHEELQKMNFKVNSETASPNFRTVVVDGDKHKFTQEDKLMI